MGYRERGFRKKNEIFLKKVGKSTIVEYLFRYIEVRDSEAAGRFSGGGFLLRNATMSTAHRMGEPCSPLPLSVVMREAHNP